jgi:hypothetical protein
MRTPLSTAALLAILALASPARPEEGDGKKEAEAPMVEIGKVKVFRTQGRVVVAGRAEVQRALVELFACGEGGKVHETVLVLDCQPSHLSIALQLLGFADGGQVKAVRKIQAEENGKTVAKEVEVVEENGPNYLGDPRKPVGDRVIVMVSWTDEGREHSVRAEDMVWDRARGRSMPRVGWVFTGSRYVQNPLNGREEFAADHSRTVMTTWHDPDALLDNPLPDGGDDEAYFGNPDVVPTRGTPVTVEFRKPTEAELAEAVELEKKEEAAAAERRKKQEAGGGPGGEGK